MHLVDISRGWQDGMVRLSGTVLRDADGREETVYFEFPEAFSTWVPESADPFVAALLIPALAAREPLRITPPISPKLHHQLPQLRDIFAKWFPEFGASPLETSAGPGVPPPGPPRAATFFSGGVDSFYTLLKRLGPDPLPDPMTHVIFMQGIETPLEEEVGVEAALAQARRVTSPLGVELISGRTNIRSFFRRHWERYYAGSGLAATALALSDGLTSVCIPSSRSYANPMPEGTTFFTDPMYSTERLTIVHDGGEAERCEKVTRVLEWDAPAALANLRVCLRNHGGEGNCGRCYKCVRTMVLLDVLGHLESSALFATKDRRHWPAALRDDHIDYLEEGLQFSRRHDADPATVRMLQQALDRRMRFDATVRFVKHSPLVRVLPALRAVRGLLGIAPRERDV